MAPLEPSPRRMPGRANGSARRENRSGGHPSANDDLQIAYGFNKSSNNVDLGDTGRAGAGRPNLAPSATGQSVCLEEVAAVSLLVSQPNPEPRKAPRLNDRGLGAPLLVWAECREAGNRCMQYGV